MNWRSVLSWSVLPSQAWAKFIKHAYWPILKRSVPDLTNVVGLFLLPCMVPLWSHRQRQHGTVGWHIQWIGCKLVQHIWRETLSVQDTHECLISVPVLAVPLSLHCGVCYQEGAWTEHCVKDFHWYIFNVNTVVFQVCDRLCLCEDCLFFLLLLLLQKARTFDLPFEATFSCHVAREL